MRVRLADRATVDLAYVAARDAGDGRDRAVVAGSLAASYPAYSFDGANFFVSLPLTYQSPQARLSVDISKQVSWNFGWQFYSYEERFTSRQDYRAHVGYSSFRWNF